METTKSCDDRYVYVILAESLTPRTALTTVANSIVKLYKLPEVNLVRNSILDPIILHHSNKVNGDWELSYFAYLDFPISEIFSDGELLGFAILVTREQKEMFKAYKTLKL